jgi:hypothetical protein
MTGTAIPLGVATAETWTPSRRMRAAAAAERERVDRELRRLCSREDSLARELEAIRATRRELESELSVLERLARDSHAVDTSGADGETRQTRRLRVVSALPQGGGAANEIELKGAQVRETAVRVLVAAAQADQAVHYRTWFELLRQQGYVPAGKDPLATFLTQIGRSPVVQRSTAPGVYSLDVTFPQRARAYLEQLHTELREMHEATGELSVDDIARVREERSEISAKIEATERSLAEALRSLVE